MLVGSVFEVFVGQTPGFADLDALVVQKSVCVQRFDFVLVGLELEDVQNAVEVLQLLYYKCFNLGRSFPIRKKFVSKC